MDRTIRAKFSHGVIEPLEKLEFSEGEEFTVIIPKAPEKQKKKEVKAPIHPTEADVFLKHAGLVSVGGDAVAESRHYNITL
jgi:predicted DNA-binding antitoxin AbrB/MazE fold protein